MADDICIEPTDFDAVVVSSGLPEVLLASALATSGRSVLLLEAADSYGADWASVAGDVFTAAAAAATAGSGEGAAHEAAVSSPHLQQLLAGCRQYTHPDYAGMGKQYIVDMAPKVLYKGEALVDTLVAGRAAHYLELKLLQGSYLLRGGQLLRVPARRADVFTSRALGPGDKGRLMRFLTAALEAAGGGGRLQGQFDGRPLVQLLQQEGLSTFLQQIVLYGIAMAHTPQQMDGTGVITPPAASAAAEGVLPTPTAAGAGPSGASEATASSSPSANGQLLTAAQGAAALKLYAESLERYNTGQTTGQSAFMVPCYSCGSLPEAFVRLAAVAGAVTVLRCGAIAVEPRANSSTSSSSGGGGGGKASAMPAMAEPNASTVSAPIAAAAGAAEGAHKSPAEPAAVGAIASQDPDSGSATQLQQQQQQVQQQQPRRYQVVAGQGQVLTTDLVIGQQQLLQQLWRGPAGTDTQHRVPHTAGSSGSRASSGSSSNSSSSSSGVWVACCVAVLDRSLVPDESLLMVVAPPGALEGHQQQHKESEGTAEAGDTTSPPAALQRQQQYVVRGVQYSPIAGVSPPGKFLLYLTAVLGDTSAVQQPAGQPLPPPAAAETDTGPAAAVAASGSVGGKDLGRLAEEVLLPAVSALADVSGLKIGASSTSTSQGADDRAGNTSSDAQQQQEAAAPVRTRPQVLQLVFSLRRQGHDSNQTHTGTTTAAAAAAGGAQAELTTAAAGAQAELTSAAGGGVSSGAAQGTTSAHTSHSSHLPAGLIPCSAADPTLVGYGRLVECSQQLLQRHCPGVPWLGEVAEGAGADVSGGAGAAAAAEVLDEEEEEAIDELTAALAELEKGL